MGWSVGERNVAAASFDVVASYPGNDDFDAYGEVPIPGSAEVHLPAGEVVISFHTPIIGSSGGGGLPVPRMSVAIDPPDGVADPVLTEDIGGTTTVNGDARVRVWSARVAAEGTYRITTEGRVSAYVNPTLAFGQPNRRGHLPVIFAVVFGIALVDLVIARVWATHARRPARRAVGIRGPHRSGDPHRGPRHPQPPA